ncbi:hypothetical protein T09_7739 [Trichinella sp. T9]|nr:hypothetical protein T09_7739 [Trichinella sp. T9]
MTPCGQLSPATTRPDNQTMSTTVVQQTSTIGQDNVGNWRRRLRQLITTYDDDDDDDPREQIIIRNNCSSIQNIQIKLLHFHSWNAKVGRQKRQKYPPPPPERSGRALDTAFNQRCFRSSPMGMPQCGQKGNKWTDCHL